MNSAPLYLPTGRRLGAWKSAAAKAGCSVEEWASRRAGGHRLCYRCREWKLASTFSLDRSRSDGFASICKKCTSHCSTASRYGMSPAELSAFKEYHGHKCGICGRTDILNVDHDHTTGKTRGLLCPNCNSAIGKFNEDPRLMAAAIAYVEKHRG